MIFGAVLILSLAADASASCGAPKNHQWQKPGPTDRRSPCPMLNSIANHGFIARSGLNISVEGLVSALDTAINLSPDSSRPVAQLAATTSTTGNPDTFNLDDLDKHGVIEHDGSLSRLDTFQGDNHDFNPAVFATVESHFTKDTISLQQAAFARTDRIKAAKAANPTFNFTAREDQFSQFETALYLGTFGHGTDGNAPTLWVKTLFHEERLPYKEGFKRPANVITNDDIVELAAKIANISDIHW